MCDLRETTRRLWGVFLVLGLSFVLAACGAGQDDGVVDFGRMSEADLIPAYDDRGDYPAAAEYLLSIGDADNGLYVVQEHDCIACHISYGDDVDMLPLAPPFEQVREVAGERRRNMSAEAYIYESIMYPDVFLVDGFFGTMPEYQYAINEQELADIMAFILYGDVMALYEVDE